MTQGPSLPPILRLTDKVAVLLALVAGMLVAVLAVLIAIDIVAREFFRFSLQGTDELGGYVLALTGAFGFAYTLLRRGHPRIDIGFRFFPPTMRRVLHVVALASLTGFAAFMGQHAMSELRDTITYGAVTNTPLKTPLWIPQFLWVVGMLFFTLTAFLMTCHGVWLLASGRGAQSDALYGPLTVEEELEEYLESDQATARGQAEAETRK